MSPYLQRFGRPLQGSLPVKDVIRRVRTLQTLAPQAQPVAAPVQHLEAIRRPIPEDEEMAAERIGFQPLGNQKEKAVEAQTHIDRIGAVPQLDGGREVQHGGAPRASTRARTKARSLPGGMRRTVPPGRTSSTAVAVDPRRTGSKRGPGWASACCGATGEPPSA